MDKIDYEGIISENEILLSVREYTVEAMKAAVAAAIPILLKYVANNADIDEYRLVDRESITSLESEIIKQLTE